MSTIADKIGAKLIDNPEFTNEDLKNLYHLLDKLDHERMLWALSWFMNTKIKSRSLSPQKVAEHNKKEIEIELEHNEHFYKYAVGNYFSIILGNFITQCFGEGVSDLLHELSSDDFMQHSFIETFKNEVTDMKDLEKIGKLIDVANSI